MRAQGWHNPGCESRNNDNAVKRWPTEAHANTFSVEKHLRLIPGLSKLQPRAEISQRLRRSSSGTPGLCFLLIVSPLKLVNEKHPVSRTVLGSGADPHQIQLDNVTVLQLLGEKRYDLLLHR